MHGIILVLEQVGAGFAVEFVLGHKVVSGGGVAGNSQLLYLAVKSQGHNPLFGDELMKITMNIECSPEEARRFLGLPDVSPMHEELLKAYRDQMMENISSLDPDAMMKSWMSGSGSGMEEMQAAFWSQFGSQFGADLARDSE
jgi:hypothetical protein